MFTIFSRIILSNLRSLITLFVVILFASTGFLVLRQLSTNIESLVMQETLPLFGTDLKISPESYTGASLVSSFTPYLSGESYQMTERKEFSTTLIDRDGKVGLVQVVTHSGVYPQRGILKSTEISTGSIENRVSGTPGLIDLFSTGGIITLDNRDIRITDRIDESSDLGFSFGTDNHLIILPESLLSGSLLLSSGSRLDHDLFISFTDPSRADIVSKELKSDTSLTGYRIRSYTDRSERTLDIVEQITDYILLIFVVSSIFALIILRSAHDSFFESLDRTLRVMEMLGLSRRRQMILFAILYSIILPLAIGVSIGIAWWIVTLIATFPEATEFRFFWSEILPMVAILILLVCAAFFPAWQSRLITVQKPENPSYLSLWIDRIGGSVTIVNLIVGVTIITLIFSDILFALMVVVGGGIFLLLFSTFLKYVYAWIFHFFGFLRAQYFASYDAIRTLVRPMTPTIPITLSLVLITTFSIVFATVSLIFRTELTLDTSESANIYAINILEQDRPKIESYLSGSDEIYSILRARIVAINSKTLEEHLGTDRPSGEFTREYNITTTPLSNAIIRGKDTIGATEVSVDDEFAGRLGIDLGDRIEFLLSGRSISLTVASIRASERQGFRPFFYFSFDSDAFRTAPKTYFVSAYTPDTESWKKDILNASGPHVTFIDIESILTIIRDISSKVLSVIGVFAGTVGLFALFAIVSFFARMRPLESMKSRLYTLFGASPRSLTSSLRQTRMILFIVSYILSVILGTILSYWILSIGSFLTFSWFQLVIILGAVALLYILLILLLRPKTL